MKPILDEIDSARAALKKFLLRLKETGGMTKERYVRLLSLQYHLNMGVQKHFFRIAAHNSLAKRRDFRRFLINFGNEEELHYLLAKQDCEGLGESPKECPLDTKLWWIFFDSLIESRPFVRLGGTCILENILGTNEQILEELLSEAKFLTPQNTKYIVVHKHGTNLPHGDQILEALEKADLTEDELRSISEGARIARTMYMRMLFWVENGVEIQ
jgi:hypothetical protein